MPKANVARTCSLQVRIWNTARSQKDIIKWMRRNNGLEGHRRGSDAQDTTEYCAK